VDATTYIGFEQLFGRSLTEEALIARVSRLSLYDCLQSVGKLSQLLATEVPDAELAALLADGLPEAQTVVLRGLMQARPRPRPLFGKQLMTLARTALLHADGRREDMFSAGALVPTFIEALVGVLDVYDETDDELAHVTDGIPAEEWFMSFRLRRVGLPHRHIQHSLVRAFRVFVDLPERRSDLVTGRTPGERFEAQTSMSLERYLGICLAVFGRFYSWNKKPDEWLLGPSYWAETTLSPAEIAEALSTISTTTEDLRRAFAIEIERGRTSIDDLRPFVLHPLIEIEPQTFLAVDVEGLGDALLGDGLFWRLRPEGDMRERSDYGETLGHLLEAHCREIAEASLASAMTHRKALFPEFRYSQGHSPDLIVADPNASTWFEIGIDRPNLRDTVFLGDLASFDRDIERIIKHRAEQLSRKIDHAKDGLLALRGAPARALDRVIPVVVLWDGFPLGRYLYDRLLNAVREWGYLTQEGVAELRVLSVEEFEMLFGLASKGWLVSDLFDEQANADEWRSEPLSEFMRGTRKRHLTLPPPLDAASAEIITRIGEQLFKARSV
jgi:hypothetical protein